MINVEDIQLCLVRLNEANLSFKDLQMTFVSLDEAITRSFKNLSDNELQSLYSKFDCYSGHHDPRIRYSALNSILNLCTVTSFQLQIDCFDHLCSFLKDSNENVKIVVMKLLLELVSRLSEHIVNTKEDLFASTEEDDRELGEISDIIPSSDDEKSFRVINDAFAKISTMLLDSSKLVRIEACKILGRFPNIDEAVLIKSVDKMLMSDMKRKRTALDRQREAYYEGTWDSNKKWTDDAPLEEMNEVDWNELTSCGIFIYALEDEYSSVRYEALEAMAALAEKSKSIEFCEKGLGQIIEVFADEIYEVRLKAAECAARIISQVSLRHDLVDVTLNSIEDELPQMREQIYKMLSECRMMSRIGVKTTVEKLLGNIQKFPQDKYSIWTVCKHLGRNNSSLVALYTPELLGAHPYFRRQDQDIKNKEYICKLIIVFNAVKFTPTIINFLEKPLDQHYSCLRDSYPELIPQLDIFSQNISQLEARPSNPKELLDLVINRVYSLKKSVNSQRVGLLTNAISDLNKLAQLHPDLEGPGSFYSAYLQCHILMTKILMDNNWINGFLLSPTQTGAFRSSLQHILCLTFTLMNAFIGLQPRLIINIQKLRVKTTALHLIAIVHDSNASALAPFEAFVSEMQFFNKLRDSISDYIETDVLMSNIVSVVKSIPDPKPGNFGRALQPLFLNVHADLLCLLSSLVDRQLYDDIHNLKMASARILKPQSRSELVHTFQAGLAFELRFVAIVKNIPDLELLRIRVQYPNQQTQVVQPKRSDFIACDSTNEYKLRTIIFISSFEAWSEEAPIEFSLMLDHRDLSQTYMTNTHVFHSFLSKSSGVRSNKSGDNLIVDLCKPVRVPFQAVRSKPT